MGVRRCAWCGRWLGLARVGWGQVTHGICRRCLRREYASMPTLAQPEAEDTGDHSEVGCFYLAAELLGAIAGGLYGTKLAAWIGWRLHWIPAAWIGALLAAVFAATWIYGRKR
mgnify:FL=1